MSSNRSDLTRVRRHLVRTELEQCPPIRWSSSSLARRTLLLTGAGVVGAALLAGCGGAKLKSGEMTIPAYGVHSQTTEGISGGSPAFCRRDSQAFARAAVLFVDHTEADAAYPADAYYLDLRDRWTDFVAHRCAPSYLRLPLTRALTIEQRHTLARDLPAAMASTVSMGLTGT